MENGKKYITITNIWVILMETITITSNVYEKSLPYKYFCNGFINITDILYKMYKIIEFLIKIYKHYGYLIQNYNINVMTQ